MFMGAVGIYGKGILLLIKGDSNSAVQVCAVDGDIIIDEII